MQYLIFIHIANAFTMQQVQQLAMTICRWRGSLTKSILTEDMTQPCDILWLSVTFLLMHDTIGNLWRKTFSDYGAKLDANWDTK